MLQCKACGYKKGWEMNEENEYVECNPQGEDFIKILGYYNVERFGYTHQVNLKACPECYTVIMDY